MYIKDIPTLELEAYFKMTQSIIDSIMRTNPMSENMKTAQANLNKFNKIKSIILKEMISRLEEITDQTAN